MTLWVAALWETALFIGLPTQTWKIPEASEAASVCVQGEFEGGFYLQPMLYDSLSLEASIFSMGTNQEGDPL